VEITGYDGDPNDGGAPAIITGSPKGTWYLRGDDVFWRKNAAGTWETAGTGTISADIFYTLEDMTFAVDFNDSNAAPDPPETTKFRSQAEVNAYLSSHGATAFKHLAAVWEALPAFIGHAITINVAAGVQRPSTTAWHPTTYVVDWSGRTVVDGGVIEVVGDAAARTEVVAAQTITAVQTASNDPYVQVGGSPFPTDGSIIGLQAELSNGVVGTIHDNTADTLYLLFRIDPAPVVLTDTVRVVRPSTVIRNSLDDVSKVKTNGVFNVSAPVLGATTYIGFTDLMFETMDNGDWDINASGSRFRATRCLFDHQYMFDTFGFRGWRSIQCSVGNDLGRATLTECSFRGGASLNDSIPLSLFGRQYFGGAFATMTACYFGNCEEYIYLDNLSTITMYNCVVDNVGRSDIAALAAYSGAVFRNQHFTSGLYSGKRTTFKGNTTNKPGVWYDKDTGAITGFTMGVWFEGFTQPCVVLNNGARLDMTSAAEGFKDGGANTGVGIQVVGGSNQLLLNAGTDVSGTAGDIEIEGVVGSYSSIPPVATPLVTQILNVIGKG